MQLYFRDAAHAGVGFVSYGTAVAQLRMCPLPWLFASALGVDFFYFYQVLMVILLRLYFHDLGFLLLLSGFSYYY